MRKMGFSVIGCGKMGERRIRSITSNKNSILISIADADNKRLDEISAKHKLVCKKYQDYKKAINDEGVDCVVISTPNKFHFPVSMFAISMKKHVLCEKPLAMNPKETSKILDNADRNGVFIKTGSNHRFFPNVVKAKELIDKNAIGNVIFIKSEIGHNKSLPEWYRKREISGGGTIIDNAVHVLDIARWFCGDFGGGYGKIINSHDNGVEDDGFAFLKSNGKSLFLRSSWNKLDSYLTIEVVGEKGSLFIECGDVTKLVHYADGKNKTYDFSNLPHNSFDLDFDELVKSVIAGRQPAASGRDGHEAIKMVSAIYESSKKGRMVSI